MKKNHSHLVLLLDNSGSMHGHWKETVQSLNKLFEEQKAIDGTMTFSLYLFNTTVANPYNFVDVKSVTNLSVGGTGGGTSLYKAFCQAVDETGVTLASMKESDRPSKVMFVSFTDGGENSSGSHYPISIVRQKLATQRDVYSWQFLFMGADFDAEALGAELGLNFDNCVNYSKGNTQDSIRHTSGMLGAYRNSASNSFDINELRGLKAAIGTK